MKEKILWKYERPNMWVSTNITMSGIIDSPIPAYCVWEENHLWFAAVGFNDLGIHSGQSAAMFACEDHWENYRKEETK